MSIKKYKPPLITNFSQRQWPDKIITKSPSWCSVDLRDGNQALPDPMTPKQKLEYFKLLCSIGFKEIEVGFPSASQDEFDFIRMLIEEDHIPEDVYIMGLTQMRPHLIEKTINSFKGCKKAIIHAYIAPSDLHMKQVFGLTKSELIETAISSTDQIRQLSELLTDSDIRYEFSPEEFTDTSLDFSIDLCNKVYEAWGKASPSKPIIFNLPATVERLLPNQYADMIEVFSKKISNRESIIISLHTHNDQGMAVAATELGLMAGADRVEGTLFGHGERTGNVDLVVCINNYFARGIETGIDLSNLPVIANKVESLTGMPIYYRQPYSGAYAFTAFSGSHQDAINKGMKKLNDAPKLFNQSWKVPYLHIDPMDIGRKYEKLIRINSQSGKGGIAWLLEQDYDIELPKNIQLELSKYVQIFSENVKREISSNEVYEIFINNFVNPPGNYELIGYWPRPNDEDPTFIHGEVHIKVNDVFHKINSDGNGPISAFVGALRKVLDFEFIVENYHEQSVGKGADAKALAIVPLKTTKGKKIYGVGIDSNIDQAAVRAIVCCLNRLDLGK